MTTGRSGGALRRGSRGAASPRVLLALVASSVVTLAVAGPMADQAYGANQDGTGGGRPARTTVERPSTTAPPATTSTAPARVLPETEERGEPSVALGAPATTERPTVPGGSTGTSGTAPRTTTVPPLVATAPTTAAAAPTTTPPPPTPPSTTPPPNTTVLTGDGIVWTRGWPGRTGTPVAGAELSRPVIVYVDVAGAAAVRFWIDDPTGAHGPSRVDAVAPFTLAAGVHDDLPGWWNPSSLPEGRHTLLAEVTLVGGSTVRRLATFSVDHR